MSGSPDLPAMGIRVAGGVVVAVPARIDLLTPYVLLEQEDWFEDEIVFLRRRLVAGARVVDIGANYGLYSLAPARIAGPSGRVWSVEPGSQTADYLRMSVAANELDQVTVIQKALSDREGTARLTLEANPELNSLVHGGSGDATEEVPLTTLDALAAEHDWTGIDLIKLDAEGEEERILAGGAAFFRSGNPLVMFEIKHGERLNLRLVELLSRAGYASYRLVPGLDVLVPFDPAQSTDPFQLNLFACKGERAVLLERSGALVRTFRDIARGEPFAHYRAAHEAGTDAALRFAHLSYAYAGMSALCASGGGAYCLGSCARIARELGLRKRATELLNEALTLCLQADPGAPQGAFLPPVESFDAVDPGGRHGEWLKASLLDGLVEMSAFSTYFERGALRQRTLDRLEALKSTGFQRTPMERRRQLMRIVAGLQPGPVPDAALSEYREDNLNPELWGGPPPGGGAR